MAGGLLALVLVVLGLGLSREAGLEPSELVARLGSNGPADRAAAAAALEELGAAALPALRAARLGSTDLVLRARAAAVLDAIEGQRLTRATMVRLDFHDRPLPEVLDALSERTGMTLMLGFDPVPNRKPPRITLAASEPIPFWTAVERLCKEGGLRLDAEPGSPWRFQAMGVPMPGQPPRRPLNGTELIFLYNDVSGGGGPVPTSDFGPFQFRLLSLHLVRDRSFVRLPQPGFMPRPPSLETERFDAQVRVLIEPRLSVIQLGEVTALDVRDDRGQSLRPDTASTAHLPYSTPIGYAGRSGPLTIRLKYPKAPGKSIARLAGRVKATVAARKPDPLVVPLIESQGQPFRNDDATVIIHEVKLEPNSKATVVELSMTTHVGSSRAGGFRIPFDNRLGLDAPNTSLTRLDFVDARGQACQSMPLSPNVPTEGTRLKYRIIAVEGVGPPIQLRYHGLVWATLDVPFAFHDLPMP
jgi:hypothetical protein